jgi:hypothetical protein
VVARPGLTKPDGDRVERFMLAVLKELAEG